MIEIDGAIQEKTKDYDKMRETILREYNLKVYRIKNEETANARQPFQKLEEAVKIN